MTTPKISVLIPIYNAEKYLHQCLKSVVKQTLRDLEIICINDGSTDNSLKIIEEFAAKDSRIIVVNKANSGYGHSMNVGLDKAQGEYIGIVESDDYADLDMFEKLYAAAEKDELDVTKAGFYYYYSAPNEKNIPNPIVSHIMSSRVICPLTSFKAVKEQVDFFNIKPTIWSAIYKRSFLKDNDIRFNETPGASFQDASFNFKVWACAGRVRLLEECFLHYRQDNENSSVCSSGKVFCVCDEYEEMENFLNSRPLLKGKLEGIRVRLKYDTYMWNYSRLAEKEQLEFLPRMAKEFETDLSLGYSERKYYPLYKWDIMMLIIRDYMEFHKWKKAEKAGQSYQVKMYSQESFFQKLKRKLIGGYYCYQEHGLVYTLENLMQKIKRRF